jgi:hypothetical protein
MRDQPLIETETASRLLAVSSDSFGVYVFRTTRMSVGSLQVPQSVSKYIELVATFNMAGYNIWLDRMTVTNFHVAQKAR